MRTVDAVELAGDVLPRKWVRRAVLLVLGAMMVTGDYTPINWLVREEAVKMQDEHVAPMLTPIVRAAMPTVTPAATP
jgi:hypothetical protein